MEHFDSQITGASCSPCLPSEPPDIRNWFSSYVYESSLLDKNKKFRDSTFKESEDEKDKFVDEETNRENEENLSKCGETRKGNQVGINHNMCSNGFTECDPSSETNEIEFQNLSKVPDSLPLSLLPSEPPHVSNWFSNYSYESPVLDASDDFECSTSRGNNAEKDGVVVGESKREKGENLGELKETRNSNEENRNKKICSNGPLRWNDSFKDSKHKFQPVRKASDSLHSDSLLSEIPDIRNWFSSYVYESPVLGTMEDFGDSSREKDRVFTEETDIKKEENLKIIKKTSNRHKGDKLQFCLLETMSISKGFNGSKEREKLCTQTDFCLEKSLEDKSLENRSVSLTKAIEESSLSGEAFLGKQKLEFSEKVGFVPINAIGTACDNEGKSPTRLIHGTPLKDTLEAKVLTEAESVSPRSRLYERKEITESGFVTTRNHRFRGRNDENSPGRPKESLQCSITNGMVTTAGQNVLKRKVLAETTNVQHSGVVEITGKWLCPQKNKPNEGPPLKQLRLERWINRL